MKFEKKHPKIFLLCGTSRVGKDTVASMITEYYEKKDFKAITLSNAYYIKDYAKRILDWDGSDENKPRTFLQQFGTDLVRKNMGEHFFLDRLLEDIEVFSYFYDVIIVSDIRAPYEIEIPKQTLKNVSSIHVVRPNHTNELNQEEKKHVTEMALQNYHNYDFELQNDGSLEDLEKKVNQLLERM